MKKPKYERPSTIKIILITMFVTLLAYVVAALILIMCDKVVPDSLTYALFGAFTGEGIVSGLLRSKDPVKDAENKIKLCQRYGIKMPTYSELFNNCQSTENMSSNPIPLTPTAGVENLTSDQIKNIEGE
ncbi:MAG: hypothetical protein WCN92_11890 [Eubacteriales bacterium]